MKRVAVGSLAIGLLVLVGCSSDPAQTTLGKIVAQAEEAASKMSSIRSQLEGVIKKLGSGEKISKDSLEGVFVEAKKLTEVGKNLVGLKADAEAIKNKIDDARREALRQQNQGKLADALNRIYTEKERLDTVMAEAEKLADSEQTRKALRDQIGNALEQFAGITRRR